MVEYLLYALAGLGVIFLLIQLGKVTSRIGFVIDQADHYASHNKYDNMKASDYSRLTGKIEELRIRVDSLEKPKDVKGCCKK